MKSFQHLHRPVNLLYAILVIIYFKLYIRYRYWYIHKIHYKYIKIYCALWCIYEAFGKVIETYDDIHSCLINIFTLYFGIYRQNINDDGQIPKAGSKSFILCVRRLTSKVLVYMHMYNVYVFYLKNLPINMR